MAGEIELILELDDDQRRLRIDGNTTDSVADILASHDLPLNTRCGQRALCDGCVVELSRGRLIHKDTGEAIEAGAEPVSLQSCEHRVAGEDVTLRVPARSLLMHEPRVVDTFRLNVPHGLDPLLGVRTGLGVAVDIGTTTVAVALVDLSDGQIVARANGFNRQMHLGDNVLTRINYCQAGDEPVREMQHAVVERTLEPLIARALKDIDASMDDVVGVVAAGNTTMQCLLAGVDPSPMGFVPFTPPFLDHRVMTGNDIGATTLGDRPIHLLPGAAAYVGADLTAGALSSGLLYDDGPSMLVDVGTNGEILLRWRDQVYGCATAAGPAFEGAGLACGVRAGDGAISHITIHNNGQGADLRLEMIGDDNPKTKHLGLCGTAYIDMLSEGRRAGLLTATGRFAPDVDGRLAERIAAYEHGGRQIRIAYGRGKEPIVISEYDFASLLQAKAAIAAGILTLLHRVGLEPQQVKTLYLAGGFGMNMSLPSAIGCGLLPGFTLDQVQLVGNTSLAGAYLALVDRGCVHEIARAGEHMHVIELNLDSMFEDRFVEQLELPG
jgi:uncharacterized 2Fe-2S/4Fe-4S cluster protein (DUF4445 family)